MGDIYGNIELGTKDKKAAQGEKSYLEGASGKSYYSGANKPYRKR